MLKGGEEVELHQAWPSERSLKERSAMLQRRIAELPRHIGSRSREALH